MARRGLGLKPRTAQACKGGSATSSHALGAHGLLHAASPHKCGRSRGTRPGGAAFGVGGRNSSLVQVACYRACACVAARLSPHTCADIRRTISAHSPCSGAEKKAGFGGGVAPQSQGCGEGSTQNTPPQGVRGTSKARIATVQVCRRVVHAARPLVRPRRRCSGSGRAKKTSRHSGLPPHVRPIKVRTSTVPRFVAPHTHPEGAGHSHACLRKRRAETPGAATPLARGKHPDLHTPPLFFSSFSHLERRDRLRRVRPQLVPEDDQPLEGQVGLHGIPLQRRPGVLGEVRERRRVRVRVSLAPGERRSEPRL